MLTVKPKFCKEYGNAVGNIILKIINLYRLSPNRESRIAIGTLFEMGIVEEILLRHSQTPIEI